MATWIACISLARESARTRFAHQGGARQGQKGCAMRFIGNQHALHFGGVTFVNRTTLVQNVLAELADFGKSQEEQQEMARILGDVIDQMEDELRDELRNKHYHADLHLPFTEK